MALAEPEDGGHNAPGASGEPPLEATGGPLVEDHPRLALLRQFLLEHYRVSPLPTARLDGAATYNAFANWLAQQDPPAIPPPSRQRFYDDVRSLGIPVAAGTGNRTQLRGIEERPHQAPALARLQSVPPPPPRREDTVFDRSAQALADTIVLHRDIVTEAVATTLAIMRESADEGRRLQAAAALMDRGIPRLKAREVDPNPAIDVPSAGARPTLVEVMEIIRRDSNGSMQSASSSKQGASSSEQTLASSKQGEDGR
jgi:hypothetical protein